MVCQLARLGFEEFVVLSLNPCFVGRWSVRTAFVIVKRRWVVLILVLLEDGLSDWDRLFKDD